MLFAFAVLSQFQSQKCHVVIIRRILTSHHHYAPENELRHELLRIAIQITNHFLNQCLSQLILVHFDRIYVLSRKMSRVFGSEHGSVSILRYAFQAAAIHIHLRSNNNSIIITIIIMLIAHSYQSIFLSVLDLLFFLFYLFVFVFLHSALASRSCSSLAPIEFCYAL